LRRPASSLAWQVSSCAARAAREYGDVLPAAVAGGCGGGGLVARVVGASCAVRRLAVSVHERAPQRRADGGGAERERRAIGTRAARERRASGARARAAPERRLSGARAERSTS